jgi:hypothetical protein
MRLSPAAADAPLIDMAEALPIVTAPMAPAASKIRVMFFMVRSPKGCAMWSSALVVVVMVLVMNDDHVMTVSILVVIFVDDYDVMMIAVMIISISEVDRYSSVFGDDERFIAGCGCGQRGHG